ncbi:ligase [Azospirillum sp. TSO22-1]|nr:ligase [Azospirillum sp. TSO22-1]
MLAPMARRDALSDTILSYPFAAAVALLGPLAGLVPRGLPVWALTLMVLSGVLLARGGAPARLRPERWTSAAVLAFLALAAASAAWSPSGRAALTVVEIGYIALSATLAGACIADLPEDAARRLGWLFVGGLLTGILIFSVENALDHPLHRWVNGKAADDLSVTEGNVPKRAAALLALLVWPAALVLRRHGMRWIAPALPLGYAMLSLLQPSRSAIVGVGLGLAVFLAAQRWASATRRALAAALAAAFAGAIPAAWLFERVLDLDHAPWLFRSAQHRVEIWWRAAGRALETPLLGQGIDASRALKPMGETSQFDPLTESLLPLHPHNAFLQVWLELGAAGAALALAIALLVLAGTARLERDDQPYALASFTAALAMVSTAYGIWQAWWMAGMLAAGLMLVLATRVPRSGR